MANPALQAMLARRALANLSLHGHVAFGQAILLAIAVDLFNQFSKPARLYTSSGSRAWWPTSPHHHLQVTMVSTTSDQALSGVRHGCRDSVGRPTGKRGILNFSCPTCTHSGATTGSVDPPRAYKSCGRDSNTIASIDGSKDASTGLSDDSACD